MPDKLRIIRIIVKDNAIKMDNKNMINISCFLIFKLSATRIALSYFAVAKIPNIDIIVTKNEYNPKSYGE